MGADTYLVCQKCKKAINVGKVAGMSATPFKDELESEEHNQFKVNWGTLFLYIPLNMITLARDFVVKHEKHKIYAASDSGDLPWETELGTIEKGWEVIELPYFESSCPMVTKNVIVAYTGIVNLNGSVIPPTVNILNSYQPVPVTIEFSKNKIGTAMNFKKVGKTITADIEIDKSVNTENKCFRPGYTYCHDPFDINITQVALLPKSKDVYRSPCQPNRKEQ